MALLRRSLLTAGLLLLATGCATTKTKSKAQAVTPLPPYRAPQDIRPADSSVTPPRVAQAPAAAAKPQLAGDWTPPAKPRVWRYIVLHHSASTSGNAAVFDREHRMDNGWDELGYHFVIDNGKGGPDGRIEVGPRWTKQKWGAHAKTADNRYNDFGIGICFVGNFETGRPTAKQLESAEKLVAWLMATYKIPARNVLGHEDTGKSTLCPGKNFSVAHIRSSALHALADSGIPMDDLANASVESLPPDRELLIAR